MTEKKKSYRTKFCVDGKEFQSIREIQLYQQILDAELPEPRIQYNLFGDRRRFDFAWPDGARRLAVEVQGGTFSGGAHVRGVRYRQDVEKHNDAVLLGWRVFWFTSGMIDDETALNTLRKVLT